MAQGAGLTAKLRDGSWLKGELVRFAAWLALAGYVVAFIGLILVPNGYHAPSGQVLLIDFLSFWAAATQGVAGAPAMPYHTAAFEAFQDALTGDPATFFSFLYPPSWLLFLLPLGTMGFLPAFLVFTAVSLALFVAAIRLISGSWRLALFFLAAPMVLNTVLHGQNALISAALLGIALALLERRRLFVAGLVIGLLTYKPQLGVLIPVALLVSGNWRTIAGAAVSTVVLALASWLAFGTPTWLAFVAQAHVGGEILENGWVEWAKMVSVYGAARVLGTSSGVAWGLQAVASLAALVAVAWCWARAADFTAKVCVLVAGGILVTPFALTYDLTVLLIPAAFLVRDGLALGFRPWEKTAIAMVILFGAATGGIGLVLGVPVAPLLVLPMLVLGLRRAFAPQPAAASLANGLS